MESNILANCNAFFVPNEERKKYINDDNNLAESVTAVLANN
nr:hypothetical protein [Rhodoferax sp.]